MKWSHVAIALSAPTALAFCSLLIGNWKTAYWQGTAALGLFGVLSLFVVLSRRKST